jgi:hypothetical protein
MQRLGAKEHEKEYTFFHSKINSRSSFRAAIAIQNLI